MFSEIDLLLEFPLFSPSEPRQGTETPTVYCKIIGPSGHAFLENYGRVFGDTHTIDYTNPAFGLIFPQKNDPLKKVPFCIAR